MTLGLDKEKTRSLKETTLAVKNKPVQSTIHDIMCMHLKQQQQQ